MPVKTRSRSKAPVKGAKIPGRRERQVSAAPVDPNATAIPFHVTAFAASVFPPPAISDSTEDEPLFDKAKPQRENKSKKR